jgi:hypothetical protein
MSLATLFGANVSVAPVSGLATVPPELAVMSTGGERPEAVFAVGSGGGVGALSGVAVSAAGGAACVVVATTTCTVPVPMPPVVTGAAPGVAGFGGPVAVATGVPAAAFSTGGVTVVDAVLPMLDV